MAVIKRYSPQPFTMAQNAGPSLSTIPLELVYNVLDELCAGDMNGDRTPAICSEDKAARINRSLSCLARTSRYFYKIARPVLFNNIHNERTVYSPRNTVARNPRIGNAVKHIYWQYDVVKSVRGAVRVPTGLREKVKGLDLRRIHARMREEDLLATLWCPTPTVRTLHVSEFGFPEKQASLRSGTPLWLDALSASLHKEHFRRLNTVRLYPGHLRLDQLYPIFQLPYLVTLELDNLSHPSPDIGERWATSATRSLSIKDLLLCGVQVHMDVITKLLPHVKAFTDSTLASLRPLSSILCGLYPQTFANSTDNSSSTLSPTLSLTVTSHTHFTNRSHSTHNCGRLRHDIRQNQAGSLGINEVSQLLRRHRELLTSVRFD